MESQAKIINIYFKVATTGLSQREHIVQLAAVGPNSETYNKFIYPSKKISQGATNVHGIYRGVDGKLFRNKVLLPACTIGIKLFCLNI